MPRVPKKILPPLNLSKESIGNRIARIRKLRGLTQLELANKIGIERSVIANYERDRLRIYDEMIARISIALRVSTDEILGVKIGGDFKEPSLKIIKRLYEIDKLPPARQKAILQNIDMYIKGAAI